MKFKLISGIMLTLLLLGMLTLAFNIQPAKTDPTTIVVPDDYETIQWAIGNATDGNTIFVRAGTYYEQVIVDKSVSLVGEGEIARTAIICNETDYAVYVSANNVTIRGFEIEIESTRWGALFLNQSSNSVIKSNIVKAGDTAILVNGGSGNKISDNEVAPLPDLCVFHGIDLSNSDNNVITGNLMGGYCHVALELDKSHNNYVAFNRMGGHMSYVLRITNSNNNSIVSNTLDKPMMGMIEGHIWFIKSNSNVLYHNNFLSDWGSVFIEIDDVSLNNTWDDGYPSGGNYWSDYEDVYPDAEEIDDSGIWNTPYVIYENNTDRYPLMNPWTTAYTLTITATYGGTTDPAPGTYMHVEGSTVQVTAKPRFFYLFDHWELDGSTEYSNPITVTMNANHTLHAVFKLYHPPPSVGGIVVPVNKLSLLAPYIGLTILLAVAVVTVVYVKKRKRKSETNS